MSKKQTTALQSLGDTVGCGKKQTDRDIFRCSSVAGLVLKELNVDCKLPKNKIGKNCFFKNNNYNHYNMDSLQLDDFVAGWVGGK